MSTRTSLLFASAALMVVSAPVMAQDGRYGRYGNADDVAEQAATAVWDDAEDAANAARDTARSHDAVEMRHNSAPRFAYSDADRVAWLEDCRIAMRGEDYYQAVYAERDEDDREGGGLIGGLLGAVVGGIAGNRIGGEGDRLLGSVVGAGVGGIAGAVLGSAIAGGGDGDYNNYEGYSPEATDAYAEDYCNAYLRRYEASGSTGQYMTAHAQPVMMMQTAHHRGGSIREVIREEWVDAPAEYVEVRSHRRAPAARRAAPRRGKLTSAN